MIQIFRACIVVFALMTLLLGFAYPAAVWGAGHLFFADKAEGSLIYAGGKVIGSALIGQNFTEDRFFHGRPSATPRTPYNARYSNSSHMNPANPKLLEAVAARVRALGVKEPVPIDLVTTSASGLDPHISPDAARIQIPRVAKARRMNEKDLEAHVARATEKPTYGFLGEPRVNVLLLNLSLERP